MKAWLQLTSMQPDWNVVQLSRTMPYHLRQASQVLGRTEWHMPTITKLRLMINQRVDAPETRPVQMTPAFAGQWPAWKANSSCCQSSCHRRSLPFLTHIGCE